MAKNNIHSIRFSDELAELIDHQVGNSFTEKFENLVTRCVWELPQIELQIELAKKDLQKQREQVKRIREKIGYLTLYTINIEENIKRATKEMDKLIKELES